MVSCQHGAVLEPEEERLGSVGFTHHANADRREDGYELLGRRKCVHRSLRRCACLDIALVLPGRRPRGDGRLARCGLGRRCHRPK